MPVANTEASHERTRIEPGEYRATCTAVRAPQLYRTFSRWYMRVDFAIHNDGSIVSKYINLANGVEPNVRLGPRSEYFKLWALAVGRKPENDERMDPEKIVGVEFIVTVRDKQHGGDGEAYSTVESVKRDPVAHEALTSSLNSSLLNHSCLSSQSLNTSSTQVHSASALEISGFQADEIPPRGPQRWRSLVHMRETDPARAGQFIQACRMRDAANRTTV